MIEKIDLTKFELTSNYVLIKADPAYGFIEIKTPTGSVQLQTSYLPQDQTKSYSISGTVLKAPDKLLFHEELRHHQRGITISHEEFTSLMRNTMQWDVDMEVVEGEAVLFNYANQIDAIDEGRIVEVKDHGYCMLIDYETLFAKKDADNLIPLNGLVIIKRDQKRAEWTTPTGLIVLEKVDQYGSAFATVVAAAKPVKRYIDRTHDSQEQLQAGDRVAIQKTYGYRIAYDQFAGDLKDLEVIRYKNILGTIY